MDTIVTKYLGPTERRGSRIVARMGPHRVVVTYQHDLDSYKNHEAAAWKVLEGHGYSGTYWLACGELGHGYVFVPVRKD